MRIPEGERPESGSAVVCVAPYAGEKLPRPEEFHSDESASGWPGEPMLIHLLSPGAYVVGASRSMSYAEVLRVVEVTDRAVALSIDLPPLRASDGLTVRAFSPGGAPLGDVDCELWVKEDHGLREIEVTDTHMRDGAVLLMPKPRVSSPVVVSELDRAMVIVAAPDLGKRAVALARGQTEAVVRFEQPATLLVRVDCPPDLEGSLSVFAKPIDSEGARSLHQSAVEVDDEKRRVFRAMAPGAYDISVTSEYGNVDTACAMRATLRSGENVLAMSLPALYPLDLIATQGERLYLSRVAADGLWSTVGNGRVPESGLTRFANLVAGRYRVCSYTESGFMDVSVPAKGPLRFEPRPTPAYVVRTIASDGPFASSGLAVGDYLVEIAGEQFASEEEFRAKVALLRSVTVEVTVLRGGARLSLQLPAPALKQWRGIALDATQLPE